MPSPIPFMGSFPSKRLKSSGAKVPVDHLLSGCTDEPRMQLHYRTLADMMKLSIPCHRLYPDQHYSGGTVRHACPVCEPEVCHRSSAALLRHMKMLHL